MIENILTEDPSATFLNSSKSDGRSVIRYFMIPSRIRFIPLRIVDLVLIFFLISENKVLLNNHGNDWNTTSFFTMKTKSLDS
jgi:hypothetical protein